MKNPLMNRLFHRIGSRLLLSSLVSILSLLALAVSHHVVWDRISNKSDIIDGLHKGRHQLHQLLLTVKETTIHLDIYLKTHQEKTASGVRSMNLRIIEKYQDFKKTAKFSEMIQDDLIAAEIEPAVATVRQNIQFCLEMTRNGRQAEAEKLRATRIVSAVSAIENLTHSADQTHEIVLQEARNSTENIRRGFRYFSISLLTLTLLLNGLIWFWLNQTISRPLGKLAIAIRSFTKGDHKARAPVDTINEIGELSETFNLMADELEKRHFKLTYQACHDRLTDLVNRREFERRLEHSLGLAKQEKLQHALVMIDLDKFKVVNDTYGHSAGDELLRQISKLLRERLRTRDLVARLGGDEFALLLECCPPENAHGVLKNIQHQFDIFHFSWESHTLPVSASIGYCEINEFTNSVTEALKQADVACYEAKRSGINQLRQFKPDSPWLQQRESDRQWFTGLNDALGVNGPEAATTADAQLVLYGQPIKPLHPEATGWHIEVLVRLTDKEGKLIPPGSFLPAAERYQLMPRIDRWVFDHTIEWLGENPDRWNRVGINLSGQSLTDSKLLEHFSDVLQHGKVAAEQLTFEITESAAIANLSEAQSFIMTLRELGCRFALDDFGSGMSSFGYLRHLAIDAVKIDGLFVRSMVENSVDYAMVRSINDIAHVMGLKTVAEFVENDEIIKSLEQVGVDFAQGYGVAKPVPLAEAAPVIATTNSKLKKADGISPIN